MNILVSDCCGAEQDDFYPDICPRCREFCVFASVIDEPTGAGEFDEDEETPESLTGGYAEDIPFENITGLEKDLTDEDFPEIDEDREPDYDGTTAREQQLSAYNQKF